MWFTNLRTTLKLASSFASVLIMMLVVGVIGIRATSNVQDGLETTFKRDLKGLDLARQVQIDILTVSKFFAAAMVEPDETKKAALMRGFTDADNEMDRGVAALELTALSAESRTSVAEVKRLGSEREALARQLLALTATDRIAAQTGREQFLEETVHMQSLLEPVIETKLAVAQATFDTSAADASRSRVIVIVATVLAAVVVAFLALFVGRIIADPLQAVASLLEKVAKGDLSARLELAREDEVGILASALNRSLDSICSTLQRVAAVSEEVSAASAELAASASQISGGAQAQAASLEETAASLEEISATVKQNTENARQAAELANNAHDAAESGGSVMGSAVAAMSEITRSSKKIADIVTTIDEIAFQTNLLALNAAVEAARAGEQGRGFGVVAAEVRSLAQRTGAASKEIRGLIADSSSKVEIGTQQVNESGKTLTEIVRSVKKVTDMVAEIAAASREQDTGLGQVNTAVTQVDQVTQSNASQTEQLSATATSLADKSSHLLELVAAFELPGATDAGPKSSKSSRSAGSPAPQRANARTSSVVRIARPAPALRETGTGGFQEF